MDMIVRSDGMDERGGEAGCERWELFERLGFWRQRGERERCVGGEQGLGFIG